jgi:transposase-like protein
MSAAELDNPAFQDHDLAREWFEARIWPEGPKCPHCGSFGEGVTRMFGKKHRPGCFQCNACREQFTVTVGTVMERSKIPLHIWLKAMYLLSASKKGMSTHQLHRMLGVSLKSTWFLMHRIRDAMREPYFGTQRGGFRKPVQADETFVGRRTSRAGEVRQRGYAEKEPILTLVGDKKVRSFHVPEVNAATLKPILREQIDKAAMVFTDEASYYGGLRTDFPAGHFTVQHNIGECDGPGSLDSFRGGIS